MDGNSRMAAAIAGVLAIRATLPATAAAQETLLAAAERRLTDPYEAALALEAIAALLAAMALARHAWHAVRAEQLPAE